jgi:hypothetical protein
MFIFMTNYFTNEELSEKIRRIEIVTLPQCISLKSVEKL